MATRVKGVTIELSADATGIEQALKDVNKSLKSTEFQLREVQKSLALDPGNLDLIEQKQRLLAKAVEETKKKLEALKDAQEDLAKQEGTEETQKQYDALTREISKTEVELNGLNEEQEKFAEESASSSSGASGFAAALGSVSEVAGTVAEKTAAISAAAAGALAAIVGLVQNSAETAAGWKQAAQEMGFSVEGFQKIQYAAAGLGIDMNDITDAIGKMNENAEQSEGSFKRIGVRVRDNNGEFKDTERIFGETITALGGIKNETERNAAATAIFGDKAKMIAPAFEDGGKALEGLSREAESVGAIVSEEDINSLQNFNAEIEKTKAMFQGAFANAGATALQALQPVFQTVAEAAQAFARVIASIPEPVMKLLAVVLLLVAAISPIARLISGITSGLGGLIKVVPMVIVGIEAINAALMSLASNPVTLYVLAIVAALALLGVAVYAVVENWESISSAASDVWGGITNAVKSSINGQIALFALMAQKVSSAFSEVKSAIEKAKGAIDSFANDIKSKINKVVSVVENIKEAFSGLGAKIKGSIGNLDNLFGNVGGDANSAGARIMSAFASGITGAIGAVRSAIEQLSAALNSLWDSLTGQARSAGEKTASAYASGLSTSNAKPTGGIFSSPLSNGGFLGGGNGGANGSFANGELLGAINALNSNLSSMNASAQPTNVNVMLSGSAANIFDTVQVQNSRLVQATGYHALA